MKVVRFTRFLIFTFLAGAFLAVPAGIRAQAPAGPLTGAPPQPAPATATKPAAPLPPSRTTILGAWKLNRDESDDPRNRKQDSSGSHGGGSGGRRGGIGIGYPGGSHGGYGGRGESDEERQKMHEFFTPANAITLSMTGAEVDLVDDRDRKRAFVTDGRRLQKSKDDNYQEITAKWDGNRLATEEKDPHGNKMSRTFELSEDGRQLSETLHMTSGHNTPLVIRFIYDIPPQTRQ